MSESWFVEHLPESVRKDFKPLLYDFEDVIEEERRLVQVIEQAQLEAVQPEPADDRAALIAKLTEAYDRGYRGDTYASGKHKEIFKLREGDDHRRMMGLAYAAEQLVALVTRRRWLNATNEGSLDRGDVEGAGVRHARREDGGLSTHPIDRDNLPLVLVTGWSVERLEIRGWLYPPEVRRDEWWMARWPHPNWSAPQSALRPIEDLVL